MAILPLFQFHGNTVGSSALQQNSIFIKITIIISLGHEVSMAASCFQLDHNQQPNFVPVLSYLKIHSSALKPLEGP